MNRRLLPGTTAVLFAAAGGATALLAGAPAAAALPAGAGIGAVVWVAHAVTTRFARPASEESEWSANGTGARRPGRTGGRGPAAAPTPPPPEDAARWLARASAAADRLETQRSGSSSDDLAPTLATAALSVRAAATQLAAAAEAIRVIDTSTAPADHKVLRRDQRRLEKEAQALGEGPLRRAKEDAARAAGERATTLQRMSDLRSLLLTTMEATVLRLEAAAERGAMLLSLQAATDASAAPPDLTRLDDELQAVQAGLDKLDEITRSLGDTGEEAGAPA
jgi:hypothetical protein